MRLVSRRVRVQQFQNYGFVAVRNQLVHFEGRIFVAHEFCQAHQPRKIYSIPGVRNAPLRFYLRDFFCRVINQRAKFGNFLRAEQVTENVIDFFANDAGRIIDYVQEKVVFAVQVAHKMFGFFRKV